MSYLSHHVMFSSVRSSSLVYRSFVISDPQADLAIPVIVRDYQTTLIFLLILLNSLIHSIDTDAVLACTGVFEGSQ